MLVEPNATRTAQTAGKSRRFTIRSDLHDEATIPSMGVVRRAQSERYELIALRIELRSECVLVVIGISPSIRDGLKPIGNAIAKVIGTHVHELPMTPNRVWDTINR